MGDLVTDNNIDICIATIDKQLKLLDHGENIWSGMLWDISKVPPNLLDIPKNAFLPDTISIGPLHYIPPGEDKMYPLKLIHLQRLLERKMKEINRSNIDKEDESRSGNMVVLKDLVNAMRDLEPRTRKFYAETSKISKDEFVNMMVVDGCFVIELLRMHYKSNQEESQQANHRWDPAKSAIFTIRWLLPNLQRDLMKLENQLPHFVLEKLFTLTLGNDPSLPCLYANFFRPMLSQDRSVRTFNDNDVRHFSTDCKHSLALIRALLLVGVSIQLPENPTDNRNPDIQPQEADNPKLIYSAQQLQEAGVSFIQKKGTGLLVIGFDSDKGDLQIPQLCIDKTMTTMLLNFVAYEQCDQTIEPFFTNYLLFLDSLINTPKDVEILGEKRILRYPLGREKDVVDFFNNFSEEFMYGFDQTFLSVNMNAVNNHCEKFYESSCRYWWSNLKKNKCSSPWTCLSLLAAIVLLTLTMLQTFYTVFPYYHPN